VTRSEERGHFAQNAIFLPLFKLSPRQGLQSPWLPACFTDTSGLLLHRSNVKSYSMPSVSSGELPKVRHKMGNFEARVVGALATPIPEVCGARKY